MASINSFSLGGIMATMNLMNGTLADQVGAQALLFTHGIIFVSILVVSLFMFTGRRVSGRVPALEAQPA